MNADTAIKYIAAELTVHEHELLMRLISANRTVNQQKLDELEIVDMEHAYEVYKRSEDDGSFRSLEEFKKEYTEMKAAMKRGVDIFNSLFHKLK